MNCPNCASTDVIFRQSRQKYLCGMCDHEFDAPTAEAHPLRIFLSYGHDEHAVLAERLKRDLEARGHEVWFDVDRLKPGGDWEAYNEEGFDWVSQEPRRGRVVLLMTPRSVRRPDRYCLNEVACALVLRIGPTAWDGRRGGAAYVV